MSNKNVYIYISVRETRNMRRLKVFKNQCNLYNEYRDFGITYKKILLVGESLVVEPLVMEPFVMVPLVMEPLL